MNRLPAEWERQDAVMMAWPHPDTDWAYMLEEVKLCFHNIAKAIVNNGEMLIIITPNVGETQKELSDLDSSKLQFVEIATNDTWARDMCPIITFNNQTARINDFKFNGWGLKFAADLDNLINTKLFNKYHIFNGEYCNHLNFALEGGSIESDGEGTILTTAEEAQKKKSMRMCATLSVQKKCYGSTTAILPVTTQTATWTPWPV